jgi:hypothetical protein
MSKRLCSLSTTDQSHLICFQSWTNHTCLLSIMDQSCLVRFNHNHSCLVRFQSRTIMPWSLCIMTNCTCLSIYWRQIVPWRCRKKSIFSQQMDTYVIITSSGCKIFCSDKERRRTIPLRPFASNRAKPRAKHIFWTHNIKIAKTSCHGPCRRAGDHWL